MRWLERASDVASYCCWCRCLRREKSSVMTMPRASRAEVASPVLLHYDLSGTPLFDDNDDSMDIVLYDTTVEYVPNKTRIRTALSSDASVENLRRQLLDPNDQQIFAMGNLAAELEKAMKDEEEEEDEEDEDDEEGEMVFSRHTGSSLAGSTSPYCYEKSVELESPSIDQSRVSLKSNEYPLDTHQQDSPMVAMFRALRCFEGDELSDAGSQHDLSGSMEIKRPRRQKQSPRRHAQKGYSQVLRNTTIDY
ncbi:uncharacterized protein LOC135221086 [Macrobrachium nipponense]|uniref:uncharacterized protein LOC135221086 n=1 Tax=Macrobrachium nipponense TaxID=159736 RepID=UPI0030C85719